MIKSSDHDGKSRGRVHLSFYDVLGVSPQAEDVVIEGAYRALLKRYHPDVYRGDPGTADSRSKAITEAYQTLKNPALRARYDRDLARDANAAPPPSEAYDAPDDDLTRPQRGGSVEVQGGGGAVSNAFIALALLVMIAAAGSLLRGSQTGPVIAPNATPLADVVAEDLGVASAPSGPPPEEKVALEAQADPEELVQSAQPSFDCRGISGPVLELICADERLASADVALAAKYQEVMRAKSYPNEVRDAQHQWIKRRNALPADPNALFAIYEERMRELSEPDASLEPIY